MQLKEFQKLVLKNLSYYLNVLKKQYLEEKEIVAFHKTKGREYSITEYTEKTWKILQKEKKLPLFKTLKTKSTQGVLEAPPYLNKTDGLKRPIPNVCVKVPTGGGKTLIALSALESINFQYFGSTTGLVLWVVPTDAIYTQTLKSFKDKSHPYRKVLEKIGAKKVKILEWRQKKHNSFSKQDIKDHLCVFLLTLQSVNRETKEYLKIFKDSGKFISFFPDSNNSLANYQLLSEVKNLDCYERDSKERSDSLNPPSPLDPGGTKKYISKVSIKQSLGNAIRIARPIVILDEGHRAYSDLARNTVSDLNPRFILELSATPNMKEHKSNVLISVPGIQLQQEEMIKLPINVMNIEKGDWQNTLDLAYDKLKELQQIGQAYYQRDKKYIRPIMLIQVERTGTDQKNKDFVHADSVKSYLIKLGVLERAIKIKTAQKDELKDEDLLSPKSPVQFIITKQALQEGWDCPFAYILTILAKSKSKQALTQLIGRILRQPYAKRSSLETLNQSYVFCYDKKAKEVVQDIKKGLQKEGMDDVLDYVQTEKSTFKRVTAKRREKFKDIKILLPKLLHQTPQKKWRGLIYEQDILQSINFSKITYSKKNNWNPEKLNHLQVQHLTVELKESAKTLNKPSLEQAVNVPALDYPFMIRRLCHFVPNAWQGTRIFEDTLKALKRNQISDKQIYLNRNALIKDMEQDIKKQVDKLAKKVFLDKLTKGQLCFKVFKDCLNINWTLGEDINFTISAEDTPLMRNDNTHFQLSLFDKHYQSQYNTLEEEVAQYLDNQQDVIKWWHRMQERQASSYYLQGWRKGKVWPDFLIACLTSSAEKKKYVVLETKGEHLDNLDTKYKGYLFTILEKYYNKPLSVEGLEVASPKEQAMAFKLLQSRDGAADLSSIVG